MPVLPHTTIDATREGLDPAPKLCRLIKEFEKEARAENLPAQELTNRKRAMVQELNNFITQKKERSNALSARVELIAESSSRGPQKPLTGECTPATTACYVPLVWPEAAVHDAQQHIILRAHTECLYSLLQHTESCASQRTAAVDGAFGTTGEGGHCKLDASFQPCPCQAL